MPSMDFNPRLSTVRNNGSQQSTQKPRPQQPDEDAFMTLPDREIAGCIHDIGVSFSVDDLRKPNPQQIQKIFEWFAELLTNTTREVVAPAMKAAAEDLCGEEAERLYSADTRELMGFFITLRKLLLECGIKDFTFADLYKPTHQRLVKIFSYIINFIRFRESQTEVIDEHYNSSERTKNMIETLYHANQEKEEQLAEMQRSQKSIEQAINEKKRRNEELKNQLLELKQAQGVVVEKHNRIKEESARLKTLLEEKTAAVMDTRQEANKLRPYTEQSQATLERSLGDLSTKLNSDKAETERLEKRTRALQTSHDTFTVLHTDISALTRVLTDVQSELMKEEDEAQKALRNREALAEKSINVRDVERQEKILRKQLESNQARTEKLRRDAEAKAAGAKKRMEELSAMHYKLSAERNERYKEVETRRIRIEQTEKKVCFP